MRHAGCRFHPNRAAALERNTKLLAGIIKARTIYALWLIHHIRIGETSRRETAFVPQLTMAERQKGL
jgi:hypothetical protein